MVHLHSRVRGQASFVREGQGGSASEVHPSSLECRVTLLSFCQARSLNPLPFTPLPSPSGLTVSPSQRQGLRVARAVEQHSFQ
jgi:hypothetical protein